MNKKISLEERKKKIREHYENTLNSFVEKVKQDPYVIAVILGGSLAYYDVGEDSNLDILIVIKDDAKPSSRRTYVENGIDIHADIMQRSRFKSVLEGTMQGSMYNSFFSKAKLIYSTDDSIKDYIKDSNYFGQKDRDALLVIEISWAMYNLYKARKFLYIIEDVLGSFYFYAEMMRALATIEVILNKQIPMREIIQQALKLNPSFFEVAFDEACNMEKTKENMDRMIKLCEEYIDERIEVTYKAVLDYLAEVQDFRTHSEIVDAIRVTNRQLEFLNMNELAKRGIVLEELIPQRITDKSQPTITEAAYMYSPEMNLGGDN